jgi:hypothetical protein
MTKVIVAFRTFVNASKKNKEKEKYEKEKTVLRLIYINRCKTKKKERLFCLIMSTYIATNDKDK